MKVPLLFTVFVASLAQLGSVAAVLVDEPFSVLDNNFPSAPQYEDWVVTGRDANPNVSVGPDGLTIIRTDVAGPGNGAGNGNAAVWYATPEGIMPGIFSGSVQMRSEALSNHASNARGVFVGAESMTYDSNGGYFIGYFSGGSDQRLGIWYDIELHTGPTNDAPLAVDRLSTDIDASKTYQLEFSVTYHSISAALYELGAETALASVTFDSSEQMTAGYFALAGAHGNSNATTSYKNLIIIPEPHTVGLALAGLALGLVVWRRRRRFSLGDSA